MRNLKRALSLLLSSTMVLGMLVMGSSAKTFTDAEDISNAEAVTIVDGLDVMNGYPDGSFKPEGIVTRAEMAVVISKMLYGPEFNPANFEGAGTFTDTPDWAEGYINLCASLDIIAGRGNGIFDPNATVTTSEAAAMFLRTLGYLQTSEEFGTDWQLAVTSKATNLGLYGDLKLSINEGLSRENVAEMAFNTLFAQRVAYDDYRGLYVKANDRNVVVTNGTEDENNTLAQNTFGLYIAEGIVTANGQTDESLSKSLKSEAQTEITFTEDTDLDKDGKAEYAVDDTYDFEVETGLDMIGHAASVYYKMENKAPVVYAIVDDATLVSVIDYNSNTTKLAQAANDAGFKKNTILDVKTEDYILNYDVNTTVKDAATLGTINWAGTNTAIAANNIPNGKKLVVISNSGNKNVDYVIVLDQYLDQIKSIDDEKEVVDYTLTEANAAKLDVALSDVAENDYVIVTNIGDQGKVLAFEAANVFSANISKITGISNSNADVKTVVADGTSYTESSVKLSYTPKLELVKTFVNIDTVGSATLIVDQFGDLIGLSGEKTLPSYAYVAQYGVVHSTGNLNTTDALTAHVYFADGTDGIYQVASFSGLTADSSKTYTHPQNLSSDEASETAIDNLNKTHGQSAASGALGIWNVTVNKDGKVEISKAYNTEETTNGTAGSSAASDGVKLVKGHSTFVDSTGAAVKGIANDKPLYQGNDTIYFYVNNEYDNGQTVEVITGIKNVVPFTNSNATSGVHTSGDTGIQQVFATDKAVTVDSADGLEVGAVLVEGIETGMSNVYYYNMGNYHITEKADGVTLTFELFDMNGDPQTASYEYDNASDAKADADSLYDGFYLIKSTGLKALLSDTDSDTNEDDATVSNASNTYVLGVKDSTHYVINDTAKYNEFVDNLYTTHDKVGTITDNVKIVDACGSGIDTRAKLVNAIKTNAGDVKIAFTYSTSDYVSDVIFISDYNPDPTDAPGTGDTMTNLLDSVQVNDVNQAIADAYDNVAAAVANAKSIKLSHNTTVDTAIDLAAKNPGTEYNGNAALYGDYDAARTATLVAGGSPLSTATSALDAGVSVSEGNYLLIAITDGTNTSYYAYTFVK